MGKERTEASTWPSRYSPGGWVRADQYIIELVCERFARKKGKDLPIKFWRLPEWEKEFKSQTRSCNRLLKKYEPKAIINAIKQRYIFSLRPKWVENVIQEEQKKLDAKRLLEKVERANRPKEESEPIIEGKRRAQRTSKFASLLALDEEEHGEESSKEERGDEVRGDEVS